MSHSEAKKERCRGVIAYHVSFLHADQQAFLTFSKGNPIYCNCYMSPLRQWARVSGVKLLGACSGPPHLSDEPLQAVSPLDLRCRRGESPVEEEESTERVPPMVTATAKPKQKVKCPANCECDVSWRQKTLLGHNESRKKK